MLVELKRISMALALLAALPAASRAQSVAPGANQLTADAVASALRASRSLAGQRIEIETRDGVVILSGSLPTEAQRAEAIARARGVRGVVAVSDRLNVGSDRRVRAAQYQQLAHGGGYPGGEVVYDGAPIISQPGVAVPTNAGMMNGPLPEGAFGNPGPTQAAISGRSNHAWPNSSLTPNAATPGYPTAYPWQAQANVTPPYPNPEIPLEWRTVTLRWDDGIWWLDFKKNYTRPFFTPYPFQIFSY